MELHEFIETFLKDYEKKKDYYYNNFSVENKEYGFIKRYFHQAFRDYTDIVCKKQMEICYKSMENSDSVYNGLNPILNAEQPEIEEL